MENPGNKFSVLNIQMSNIYFMKILIKKADFREISPAAGISIALLLLFIHLIRIMYCHPSIWTPISAISSPFSFNILCLFALLTLDGSSHLIGSNFKTNYSLEPLKICPYYCVPYLWEIFSLLWFLQCSNKIIFLSVYDFRIMILSAAIVCFETFTDQSTYQQGLDSLWGYFYSL